MKLSDLKRQLEHLIATHGDLPVVEERQVWYDSFEFFKNGILLDERVVDVAAYHGDDGKHRVEKAVNVTAAARDRREFKAFVL